MDQSTTQTLKGFRDFLPEKMRVRNCVQKILQESFEEFGFEPLQTPSLEYAETLLKKYSAENDKETYIFEDLGKRKVGLIYDLTVPVARVLSQVDNNIVMPFKRYQIQRCYRAEKPQRGRFREFVQCDIDIFGVTSELADAEVLACGYKATQKLGFTNFSFLINDRNTLFEILQKAGVSEPNKQLSVLRSLDKLEKIGQKAVSRELASKRFPTAQTALIFSLISQSKPSENLINITNYAVALGVPKEKLIFSPTLSRGADYYTGMVVEGVVTEPKIGSILGGGRYDKLIESFGGKPTPATGISFGFERVCEVVEELDLLKNVINAYPAKVLICPILNNPQDLLPATMREALWVGQTLRQNNIPTDIFLKPQDSLAKQIKYANAKNIPYIMVIGSDEVEKNVVSLKNLATREQQSLPLKQAIKFINLPACHTKSCHC
ncbi:histidine--tRNA ligase [Candidatus Parcubacteria bacterium]|nr:histidine--tRNA ligase [Patescibacteria group bacterium]MCG2689010.1 histidine--tRNA ligase [Candidatus Parcubacteria bacterium]